MEEVGCEYKESEVRYSVVNDALAFVIQYFPLDMSSLHSMLFLSKDICSMIKHNAILWVSIAKRISKRCQACFLEARDSAQYSDCPGYQYWRDSVEVLSAANSLRCQWGISASSRVFVNTGNCGI